MVVKELLKKGIEELSQIEQPSLIARIVLAYILKQDKQYLLVHQEDKIDETIIDQYMGEIRKIARGYPLQYITHQQEFMKLKFYVDDNVLIPRADTEILVEEVIKEVENKRVTILDICTGSGAIGISLAKYLPQARVYLADISKKALEIAKENAKGNKVEKKVEFIHSDMFDKIPKMQFDVIVSNPPYIESQTIQQLDIQVQKEPTIALDGGKDGLDFYRILANKSWEYLKSGGLLGLEIGYNQKKAVQKLLEITGEYQDIKDKQDLAGLDRVIIAKRR